MFCGKNRVYSSADLTLPKVRLIQRSILALAACILLFSLIYVTQSVLADLGLTALALEKEEAWAREKSFYQQHPEKIFEVGWQYSQFQHEPFALAIKSLVATEHYYLGWKLRKAQTIFTQDAGQRHVLLDLLFEHTSRASFLNLPNNSSLGPNGQSLSLQRELGSFAVFSQKLSYQDFYTSEYVRRVFLELAQQYKIKTSLELLPRVEKKIGKMGVFFCPWIRAKFTLSNVRLSQIESVGKSLATIWGLALERISLERGMFTLTGYVYAKA